MGEFNAYNLLAALSVLLIENIPLAQATELLSQVKPVPGRMEEIRGGSDQEPLVVVDYAHTPDALENILKTRSFLFL